MAPTAVQPVAPPNRPAVHAGIYRGRPVAIKTLHDTSKGALAAVEAELLVHASLRNNRRIVELLGASLEPPGCCIVMEQCDCSLFERLHRRPAHTPIRVLEPAHHRAGVMAAPARSGDHGVRGCRVGQGGCFSGWG